MLLPDDVTGEVTMKPCQHCPPELGPLSQIVCQILLLYHFCLQGEYYETEINSELSLKCNFRKI